MKHPNIRIVEFNITPREPRQASTCPTCSAVVPPASVTYEVKKGDLLFKSKNPLPGYFCSLCEIPFFDGPPALAIDEQLVALLPQSSPEREALQERIDVLRPHFPQPALK